MASDALRRILGGQIKGFRGYKLCRVVHENEPHYYLTTPAGKVLDPTSAQFKTRPPYDKGRGVGLPTPSKIPGTDVQSPTHGAKAIMERAKAFSRTASDRKAPDSVGRPPSPRQCRASGAPEAPLGEVRHLFDHRHAFLLGCKAGWSRGNEPPACSFGLKSEHKIPSGGG